MWIGSDARRWVGLSGGARRVEIDALRDFLAVVAPKGPLLGLISVIAPVIVTGNTCVVIASEEYPLVAITLAEVMATAETTTADVPRAAAASQPVAMSGAGKAGLFIAAAVLLLLILLYFIFG